MEVEKTKSETPKIDGKTRAKAIGIMTFAVLMYSIGFLIGWIDRVITAPFPFVKQESLFKMRFYTHNMLNSLSRVLVAAIIYMVYKFIFA